MSSFLAAVQFLTVLPVKIKYDTKVMSRSMTYFPLVGLLLGAVLTGAGNILTALGFNELALNMILIVLLTALTGALHLDGLADTCDALLSGKDKRKMLEIMRDPHIGVMGVLSVICVILLKISLLSSISLSIKPISLILMCVLSRWAMVLSIFSFPYARTEGKAKIFIDIVNPKIFVISVIITIICAAAVWGIKGVSIFGIIAIGAYVIGKFVSHKLGGITGDTLGATNELMEVISLFCIKILTYSVN